MQPIQQTLRRLGRRIALACVPMMTLLVPVIVWADTAAPNPSLKKAPPAWLGMLVMFILLALVLGVSLLPSKRGHQD